MHDSLSERSTKPAELTGTPVLQTTNQMPERSLRLAELQQIVPYSQAHLGRLERAGQFPKRVKIGAGRVVWMQSEVLAWLAAKRVG